jgi:hypothetical protein
LNDDRNSCPGDKVKERLGICRCRKYQKDPDRQLEDALEHDYNPCNYSFYIYFIAERNP